MDAVTVPPFTLQTGRLGQFKRNDGALYFVRIIENPALLSLYAALTAQLQKQGFEIENRKYTPHLTLGREVRLAQTADLEEYDESLPVLKIQVTRFNLMKSERINGKMVYTPIYDKELK